MEQNDNKKHKWHTYRLTEEEYRLIDEFESIEGKLYSRLFKVIALWEVALSG